MSWSFSATAPTKAEVIKLAEEKMQSQREYIPDPDVLMESVSNAVYLLPDKPVDGAQYVYLASTNGHVGKENGFVEVRAHIAKLVT